MSEPLAAHLSPGEWDQLGTSLISKIIDEFAPNEWELLGIERCLGQSYTDVCNLDAWASKSEVSIYYRSRFLSYLKHPKASEALYRVGRLPWDKKATREISRPQNDSGQTSMAILAHGLRELLRDGWTWEQVRKEIGKPLIDEALNAKAAGLFKTLRAIERQQKKSPFQRSPERWILRAWIPLGLWTCSAKEGDSRVEKAHRCLSSVQSVDQSKLPSMRAEKAADIEARHKMIRRVRSWLATGQRN